MAQKNSFKDTTPKNSIKSETFSNLGSLVKLLPTGTVFLFQFLNPLLTNNGGCNSINKLLCAGLIGLSGLACFISSFTDSYIDLDGSVHYGIATGTGFWPSGDGSVDLSKYRLRTKDFVHAMLSLIVFGVVSYLDINTVQCFYPKYEKDGKLVISALPLLIGMITGTAFMLFPNNRHGIGYPLDDEEDVMVKS